MFIAMLRCRIKKVHRPNVFSGVFSAIDKKLKFSVQLLIFTGTNSRYIIVPERFSS